LKDDIDNISSRTHHDNHGITSSSRLPKYMPLSKIKKALKWICNKLKRSQSEIDEKLNDEENNHLNHTNEQEKMVIYENK
jgi:hypothetical protein